jgi:hypothetical protein
LGIELGHGSPSFPRWTLTHRPTRLREEAIARPVRKTFPYGKFGFGTRLLALPTRTNILLFGRPRIGWPRAGCWMVGKWRRSLRSSVVT